MASRDRHRIGFRIPRTHVAWMVSTEGLTVAYCGYRGNDADTLTDDARPCEACAVLTEEAGVRKEQTSGI